MAKISKISGFPEWLPEQKLAEDRLISKIKAVYEGFGFVPIETPAVELLSTLQAKGFQQKEIYVINRAAADEDVDASMALHFDLTVPFARYVAQHYSNLSFPFRRYQIQKAWRGERPQKGRFREFYQFDIDVIARENLPISFDAEILSAYDKAFNVANVARHQIHLNNRKLLLGFYSDLGISKEQSRLTITAVDKINKIGKEGVEQELVNEVKLESALVGRILEFIGRHYTTENVIDLRRDFNISNALFQEGIEELARLVELLSDSAKNNTVIDLSMARGLDYYTGTIFEVYFPDYPDTSSFGGGGRYDDLASHFINRKLPGVGGTIGLSRLIDFAFQNELLDISQKTLSQALVAVYSEDQRRNCNQLAEQLRELSVPCEVFYQSPKLGKQIDYAASKGIRYVFFLDPTRNVLEVKDLETKEQEKIDNIQSWVKARNIK